MKNVFKWLLIVAALLAMLAMWSGFALWQGLHEFVMQPDVSVSINGEDIDFEGLREWASAPWYEVMLGWMIAGLVLCLVLPLVLIFSIGLPVLLLALILGGLTLGLLSLGGLLFSPFIVLVLLIWLMVRNKRRNNPAGTTSASSS